MENLNDKSWYRALKVLYIIAYISFIILVFLGIVISVISYFVGESGMETAILFLVIIGVIIVPLFFYIVKHTFFYIITGTWNMEKEESHGKIQKQREKTK